MTTHSTRKFRGALAAIAGLLVAAGATAAEKEPPKQDRLNTQPAPLNAPRDASPAAKEASAPTPAADNTNDRARSSNNEVAPGPDRDAAPKSQLNPTESKLGTGGNVNDNNRASQQDKGDAQRDLGRRDSGAIRHQVNRPSSESNAARPQTADRGGVARGNRTNIGLAFGNNGLQISSVGSNGYFGNAGFRNGDQIVSAGGRQFANQAEFYTWLGTVQAGQRMPFIISRNGQQQTVYWTPNEQFVQAYAQAAPVNAANFLGIQLDTEVRDAAVVADVQAGSPAQRAGVRPNDMILSVNGRQVSSPDDFDTATGSIQDGSAVDLAVSRTMNVQLIPAGQAQGNGSQLLTGAPPAVAPAVVPAPVQTAPVAPAPAPIRRGLFRNR